MASLELEIVTPEKVLVKQTVDMVVAPGSLGEFGVLPGHVPFLTGIVPGELRYTAGGKTEQVAVVSPGFCEVSENRVSILVEAAERAREIDVERARHALERARARLSRERGSPEVDIPRAEAALERALVRVKVAERKL
jgi:F-type H+-transporting ATPase subunit epsilon